MLGSVARGRLQQLGLLSPEWPAWAVDTFVSLSLCCAALVAGQWVYDRPRSPPPEAAAAAARKSGDGEAVGGPSAASFRR